MHGAFCVFPPDPIEILSALAIFLTGLYLGARAACEGRGFLYNVSTAMDTLQSTEQRLSNMTVTERD